MKYRLYDMPLPGRKCVEIHSEEGKIIIPQLDKGKYYSLKEAIKTNKFVNEVLNKLNKA